MHDHVDHPVFMQVFGALEPLGQFLADRILDHPLACEAGGLSGEALTEKSRHMLYQFHQHLQNEIPIISVGGIASAEEAQLRIDLGARLIQIYSALIFEGPGLVHKIAKSIVV